MEEEKVTERDEEVVVDSVTAADEATIPDYEIPEEDSKALADPDEDAKEPEKREEAMIEVSPFLRPDETKKGKTKKYEMPNGEFVAPIEYEYRPMRDIERARYSEKVRRSNTIEEIRKHSYAALAKHVVSTSVDGFEPSHAIAWSNIRPIEIIEEILDAVVGQVKIPESDLRNFMRGSSS